MNAQQPPARLADRMGVTVHRSPLRIKIRRLMHAYHAPEPLTIEDWLIDLINRRGATVVFRDQPLPATVGFPGPDEVSDEELVVALCQLNCADRPQILRPAAQLISRNQLDLKRLIRFIHMERTSRVVKSLAEQALKVAPDHPAWRALHQALRCDRDLREPLLHWTRLAEPVFAPRSTRTTGWRLVS